MTNRELDNTIPDIVRDERAGVTYIKGRFYGKGGFGKCYELKNSATEDVFAGKIVSKKQLQRSNQKDKMLQEIEIHKSLSHKHVVGFYTFFEDSNFLYLMLELCKKRSLMELHKRRKALLEPEVRYFMKQLLEGVSYLHSNNIIHRDLKLGNLFLNDKLMVKIGDFGLATRIEFSGQRKRTLCGTPNYIAPEVLTKRGHSFEVDIWSLGCIMYTLLVGKPPFETNSLQETYSKIKRCEYMLPPSISEPAAVMINLMLQPEPLRRPQVNSLCEQQFMKGYCPRELPVSCLTVAPRFDPRLSTAIPSYSSRRPLIEINERQIEREAERKGGPASAASAGAPASAGVAAPVGPAGAAPPASQPGSNVAQQCFSYLKHLLHQINKLLTNINFKIIPDTDALLEELSDPDAQPFVWISKWVDYTDKYGFGYQLADDGVGVMFNDDTRLLLLANQQNIHYIDRDGGESYYMINKTPEELEKKMKLLGHFRKYMHKHLVKAGASVQLKESDSMSRIPYLHQWHRSPSAVVMQLTNGTLQINFNDHSKIVLCPLLDAVTYMKGEKEFRTFRFTSLLENGCAASLKLCLEYAAKKIPVLMSSAKSKC